MGPSGLVLRELGCHITVSMGLFASSPCSHMCPSALGWLLSASLTCCDPIRGLSPVTGAVLCPVTVIVNQVNLFSFGYFVIATNRQRHQYICRFFLIYSLSTCSAIPDKAHHLPGKTQPQKRLRTVYRGSPNSCLLGLLLQPSSSCSLEILYQSG